MKKLYGMRPLLAVALLIAFLALLLVGCSAAQTFSDGANAGAPLALPTIEAMTTNGEKLQVLATTSIMGDVIRQVGGEAIDLTVLMKPGQDPHSYQPATADLTAAAGADIIFINGWNLEEGLVDDLATIGRQAVIVPVSAGITPLALDESDHDHAEEEHEHGAIDPHVWQDVANIRQWVENIPQVLGAADPANAALFDANAANYDAALQELDAELRQTLAAIPAERRVLVTNHNNLGYFAAAYGFEVAGTVIPSASTLAEPSAAGLANLIGLMRTEGICSLIMETTAADQLARTLEKELTGCDEVRLVTLYTDALGPDGSGADSYIGMMRANAGALVEALGE